MLNRVITRGMVERGIANMKTTSIQRKNNIHISWPSADKLPEIMLPNCFTLWDAFGDGNCLFWCLLEFEDEECTVANCQRLRDEICQFIRDHPTADIHPNFSIQVSIQGESGTNNLEAYIQRMANATPYNCEYGTYLEAFVFAIMKHINVAIYHFESNGGVYKLWMCKTVSADARTVCLYYNGNHYELMDASPTFFDVNQQVERDNAMQVEEEELSVDMEVDRADDAKSEPSVDTTMAEDGRANSYLSTEKKHTREKMPVFVLEWLRCGPSYQKKREHTRETMPVLEWLRYVLMKRSKKLVAMNTSKIKLLVKKSIIGNVNPLVLDATLIHLTLQLLSHMIVGHITRCVTIVMHWGTRLKTNQQKKMWYILESCAAIKGRFNLIICHGCIGLIYTTIIHHRMINKMKQYGKGIR